MLWARTTLFPRDASRAVDLVLEWLGEFGVSNARYNQSTGCCEYEGGQFDAQALAAELHEAPRLLRVELLKRRLTSVLELRRWPVNPNFARVRAQLLPVCRSRPWLDLGSLSNEAKPLSEDLGATLQLQDAPHTQLIRADALLAWGVPFDRAWSYAVDTLANLPCELTTLNAVCFLRGPSASSLMFHQALGSRLRMQEPLVVIAPNTDALVVFQPNHLDGFELVNSMVSEGLESMMALSATPLLKVGAALSVWQPHGTDSESLRMHQRARQSVADAAALSVRWAPRSNS